MNHLVGKLVGAYSGPILVVGGAPGALEELEIVRAGLGEQHCRVISANEHAIHAGLKPEFACVNDDIHSTLGVHQEPRMRELMPGVKLLSRHWWADYRSPQLLACNSGLKAILYAAILGANPVIVIGIQHYSNGLYFHPDKSRKKNPNLDRGEAYFRKQTNRLVEMLKGVPVRPVSGPLTQLWPKYDPSEVFHARRRCTLEDKAEADAATQKYVCTLMAGVSFETALVPERAVFAVTEREYRQIANPDTITDATGWGDDYRTDVEVWAAFEKAQEEIRVEHNRLVRLVNRVRNGSRGVRRGIKDADILRILKWLESGDSHEMIGKRIGLPAGQIGMIATAAGLDRPPGL